MKIHKAVLAYLLMDVQTDLITVSKCLIRTHVKISICEIFTFVVLGKNRLKFSCITVLRFKRCSPVEYKVITTEFHHLESLK